MTWLDYLAHPVTMAILGLVAHACKKMARIKREKNSPMAPTQYLRTHPYQTVTAVIGLIVGMVILRDIGELTALNAFTLGYMANSVADLLGNRSLFGKEK